MESDIDRAVAMVPTKGIRATAKALNWSSYSKLRKDLIEVGFRFRKRGRPTGEHAGASRGKERAAREEWVIFQKRLGRSNRAIAKQLQVCSSVVDKDVRAHRKAGKL